MRARIVPPTPENLRRLAHALQSGEVVAMPTETVYGLAGDALNEIAVSKIFEAKERPTFDPLIVHVPLCDANLEALSSRGLVDVAKLTPEAASAANRLMSAFWPGPLTLVLPKLPGVSDLVTSGLGTVGIRMPSHPAAQALLNEAGTPLAAPSANRFGRISPTSASDVESELGDRIHWILDGGRSEVGLESTVLLVLPNGTGRILRPGGVSADDIFAKTGIRAASGTEPGASADVSGTETPQVSPGGLSSHYAPSKTLALLPRNLEELSADEWEKLRKEISSAGATSIGIILMRKSPHPAEVQASIARHTGIAGEKIEVRALSQSGSLREIAHRLFATLRELDDSQAGMLFSEPSPSKEGLGFAIADRLGRASFKRRV